MVGLPARGKTFIAQRIRRYLQWLGISTKLFNVGNYRRKLCGAELKHDFFDSHNQEAAKMRQNAAMEALEDMKSWFEEDVDGTAVAIYDATNSRKDRREIIKEFCDKINVDVLFLESICTDESLILQNIMQVKVSSPDYAHMMPEEAAEDFKNRIRHYEEAYETMEESDLSFVQIVNVSSKVIINKISCFLQSRIVYYLVNLHIKPRSIYISRHGESEYNLTGRIGGDANLSCNGLAFAKALPDLINKNIKKDNLVVWTSSLKRTIQTAQHLPYNKIQWKALDEIHAGQCDGLTYEEIAEKYPEDFSARDVDKFNYRYRSGESYADLVTRLEPVIMELERQENILIISHQAVLRAIYAYFMNLSHEQLPYVEIPLHTVIKITPRAYGCDEERFPLEVPGVNTHRSKPNIPGEINYTLA